MRHFYSRRLLLLLLLGVTTFKLSYSQNPVVSWDKAFGGSHGETFKCVLQTVDGGFLLGGHTSSGVSGDKTLPSRGNEDYWIIKTDANGSKLWDKTFGGNNIDILYSIIETSDGNFLLGGLSRSGVSGDKTEPLKGGTFDYGDYWIVKTDANGNKIWDKSFGANGIENLSSLIETTDGGFLLVGTSNSGVYGDKTSSSQGYTDYWVVKTDRNGNKQWDKTFGGENLDNPMSIAKTTDGGYLFGGFSNSRVSGDKTENSKGGTDYWIVKTDANGNKIWDKTLGGNYSERLSSLIVTSDGGYLLGGYSRSGVSGDKTEPSEGGDDYWIVKTDANGNKQWDKTYGGNTPDELFSIVKTVDEGFLLGGRSFSEVSGNKSEPSKGGYDYWILKTDAIGNKQWDRTLGGSSSDILTSVTVTTDGDYILGGYSGSGVSGDRTEPSKGSTDYWIVKLSLESSCEISALAKNITVQLNSMDNVTVAPSQVDNGSSDSCGDVSLSLDRTSFDCTNLGLNPVILTVTDSHGNTATANAIVTVEDVTAPVVSPSELFVELDEFGMATITPDMVPNEVQENCAIKSKTLDRTSFTCEDALSLPFDINLIVEDMSGNVGQNTVTVTVVDKISPTVKLKDITVELDETGNVIVEGEDFDNGSWDICQWSSLNFTVEGGGAFTCENLGTNPVTVIVKDIFDNWTRANANVTIVDSKPPIAVTQNITVQLDASGNATVAASQIDNGSSDACGAVTLSLDKTSFDCSNLGTNAIILTVTDSSGNIARANATVTVEDQQVSSPVAQNIIVQLDASGNATVAASQIDDGSSDVCGNVTLALDKTSFDCANLGANPVVLTVTDSNGNIATANATVTVEDKQVSSAVAKNITVQLDDTGNVTVVPSQVDNGSYDACGDVTLALDKTSFDCSNIGANPVVLTVTDSNGNEARANAVVTIEDKSAPVVSTKDFILELVADGTGSISVEDINNGSADTCDAEIILTLNRTDFTCSDVGSPIEVTLTATDKYNNRASATAKVTVLDKTAPTISAKNFSLNLDANGSGTLIVSDILDSAFDSCDEDIALVLNRTSFSCSDLGVPVEVTLTATDDYGNASSAKASVTVLDETAPVVVTKDFELALDASGNGVISVSDINNGSSDSCDEAITFSLDRTSFNCSDIGVSQVVKLTATDKYGNSNSRTASVTVLDKTAPVVVTQDYKLVLGPDGTGSISPSDIDNGSVDACDEAIQLSLSETSFDCSQIGTNQIVTLTATDKYGNSDKGTAVVTVVDETAPTVLTQNYTLILGPDGNGSIAVSDIDNGSSDSCDGGITLSLDRTSFNCSDIGTPVKVILTARDTYNNEASGTAVVTVVDGTAPTVLAKDFILILDADGTGSISPSDIDNGSFDSCDEAISLSLNRTSFSCVDIGTPVTVTLTVKDKYNNEASKTAVVTVLDETPPVVSAKDFTIEIGENGTAILLVSDVLNGLSDDCDDEVQLSLDKSEFGCGDIGTVQVVTLTAKDKYNNSNSATANITVVDKVTPALSAKDFTLVINAQGTGTLLVSDILVDASDNCDSNLSLSLDRTEFTCEDIGIVQAVKLTAADQYGNSTTVNSNITVVDETAPVISTNDFTLELGVDGAGNLVVQDILSSVSDSCDDAVSISLDKTAFTCTDLEAPVKVTLTAKDKYDNVATSTANITVVDKLAPTLQLKNLEISLDTNGQATVSEVDLNNGSSDNCGIAEWQISQTSFDCSDIGSNSISVTVKDASGNTATGNATVVVKPFEVQTSIAISPSSQQYSDEVTFTARIKNGTCSSGSGAAQEVSFYVGSQKMGTISLKAIGADLVGSLTTKLTESPSSPSNNQLSPGDKVVSAKFEKVNTAQYIVKNATTSLAIQKENAIVEYVGQEIQATVSSTNSQATVLLKVNVQDNSVNDMQDSYPGDIRNARVKFVNRDNNSDISGWLPVQLLYSDDATTGSASFLWTVNIGSADALSYTVGIVVDNGYYYQSSSDDNVVLTVYKPNGDFITGGGYIRPSASYGEYSSTEGKKMNFGFNVKYNKKGNKLNGHMNVIFRKVINGETRIFQIKGNAIQSLGINSKDRTVKTAEFITKSNLTDITNPLSPVSLGGNLILKVNMTDRGEPGTNDLIGVSLTNNNTLLFSSHWNGLSTEEINLSGGNLVIHSNSVSAGTQETDVVKTVELLADTPVLDAVVSPNPSDSYFTLKVDSQNQKDRVQVTVHSYSGAILYNKFGKPSEQYIFGNDFAAGTYIVKVFQANQMVEKIIIKN